MATPTSSRDNVDDLVGATKAVGDHLRANILRALKEDSFGVLELCHIFSTPQPALSHHLKVLHQARLVAKRREGNSIFYRRHANPEDQLRTSLFAALDDLTLESAVETRLHEVHERRRLRSEEFFAAFAGKFRDQQALISEAHVYAPTVMDLIRHYDVESTSALEIGPGDGELLCLLAERFTQVIGIDSTKAMLQRTAERVRNLNNVLLLEKEFTALPRVRKYQCVVAAMVVHHMAAPQLFFHQAYRVLKFGGLLVVVELCRHDHTWVEEACGDLWLGFEPQELNDWAVNAGFDPGEPQYLAQKNGFRIQIQSFVSRIP
ncbi:MAG: metalloregulator ArsR/SmtB family transcription factor [Gammaproteobacteria bacterium]|nr:MAG: metalloregulator ArsR/SmtB family transcription factor [Gammaproteobacteria bacterium]